MIDMTRQPFKVGIVRPVPIPENVRLEPGMMLAQKIPERPNRPEYHKLIVLVRPTTLSKRVSTFDPDNYERHDVAAWISVRLWTEKSHPHPGLGAGTLFTYPEKPLRSGWMFAGYLGKVLAPIDWDSM